MELANCMLALGGDRGYTVPKFNVTPAEIAVMCAIHGGDAVHDIAPTGETTKRSKSEEIERLMFLYGKAKDEDGKLLVGKVFPGGALSPMHETLADLGLPEDLFAVTDRVKPGAPAKKSKAKAAPPLADIVSDPTNADALFDE